MLLTEHWQKIYAEKSFDAVSWYQEHPQRSLQLIGNVTVSKEASLIDVGGGASRLVDHLLAAGYSALTVLDISNKALAVAQQRLGSDALKVTWLEADITSASLPSNSYDVWHDRAVFHFLTNPQQRAAYVALLEKSLKPSGHLIIATFAENAPLQCSGLPICRYSPSTLSVEFGNGFELQHYEYEVHETPSGAQQDFIYAHFQSIKRDL